MEIAFAPTIYIDNDKTFEQAMATLDDVVSKYPIKFYARVTKIDDKYREILKRFDSVTKNDRNILARSWNKSIEKGFKDGCEFVIISNLDLKLYDYTIDNLVDFAKEDDSVMWSGRCINTGAVYPEGDFIVNSYTVYDNFAFPMVGKELFKKVGKFDENFIPCYGEDVDIQYRIELAGEKHTCVNGARFVHYGQTTVNNSPEWKGNSLQDGAHEYFIRKWGGPPRGQVYLTPFNK